MTIHKLPLKLQNEIRNNFLKERVSNMLTLEEEIEIFANELKNYFTKEELEKIAREVGFVQRKGKLEAWHFLFLCSFMEIDVAKDTLSTICSRIGSKLNIIVSNQAIDKRFTDKCVEFLKNIFKRLLRDTVKSRIKIPGDLDKYFNRIRILDSTGFQLPEKYNSFYPGSGGNSTSAGMKIQLEFELKSGEFINIEIESGKDSDCTYGKSLHDTVNLKDLVLRDLGYFDLDVYEDINAKGAFYISRIKLNTVAYMPNDNVKYYKNGSPIISSLLKKIDFLDIMKNMKEGETVEIKKAFIGEEKKLPARLIVYKHTEKELKKIVEAVKKDSVRKGKAKSEKTMALLGVCLFITNIPNGIIHAKEIHDIYSLRWQIELVFKTWKSIYSIAKVKSVKVERFECQLYGKLILVLLSSTITYRVRTILLINKKFEISEIKTTSIICEYFESLYLTLICLSAKTNHILNNIFATILKNGKKSHRKEKKTVFDIMGVSYEKNICNVVTTTA